MVVSAKTKSSGTTTNMDKTNNSKRPLSHASDSTRTSESCDVLVLSNKMMTNLTSEFLTEQTAQPDVVSKVLLERNKLKDLPFELVDFINLEVINLSYNCFHQFPTVICEMLSLREIIMVGCEIEALPSNFDQLSSLETIILDLNHLRKIGDTLCTLNKLTTLSLGMNYFSVFYSTLPDQITKLNLDNNHLTLFPDCILALANLRQLNLSFNRIKELPVEIDGLAELEELLIVKNRLHALPSTICNLVNLKVMDLSNNNLEVLPGNISNMVSLEEINVVNNPIIQPPKHICEHGIDAIKAFQDCLKKQLYEPCNRAIKIFILGASGSGKTDLFNFLAGRQGTSAAPPSSPSANQNTTTKKKFAHYSNNVLNNLSLTVLKFSGKEEYSLLSQLFFTRNALYIICVQMDRYKSSTFRNSVLAYVQLVQTVIPDAIILLLPCYVARGARSPITKLQFDKNFSDLQNLAKNYIRISTTKLVEEIERLMILRKENGFELWTSHRINFLQSLCKSLPKFLPNYSSTGSSKKQVCWKISKNEKCGEILLVFLKELTHSEEFFASNLQDEIQSSWKTLEKLITSYRKKNSGRLYLNRNDIMEPAVQIGVNSAQMEEVVQYLNIYGVICVFDRVAHLRQCLFHDPKTLIDFFNSVLDIHLLERKDDPCLQQFSPFEIHSTRGELKQHGVITEEMLVQLMRDSVPEADSVDFNYFAALLRNLHVARKVDASNIKEVTKSRNVRSSALNAKQPSSINRSNHKYVSKQRSSLFKRDRNKFSRASFIGRSSSQSDEAVVPPSKKSKNNLHKRVFSYNALPDDVCYHENNSSKMKYKSSYFFPWYIAQEYSPQEPMQSEGSDKSRVMTLWPGYLRSSLYKLQVVCIFKNFTDVLSIFHRLSVALHHCVDFRDDWRGRLSATMESLPLLIEVDNMSKVAESDGSSGSGSNKENNGVKGSSGSSNNGKTGLPCLSISSKSEIVYSHVMWTIIIKVVETLLKLFLEYPGLNYELQLICPHCLKRFPNKQLNEMQRYPWEQIFFNLKDFDAADDIDDLGLSCPYMNTTERLPTSLLIPQPIEFDPTFTRYFDEILPSLSRTNWRQFAKRLGMTDIQIDSIRDSVSASYNFARQKELMLIFWHRLYMSTASTIDLVEACKSLGFTFLVNKLTALQSKLRVPSIMNRGANTNSQSSFSANQITSTSSVTSESMSNVSESCQSIFEESTPIS